MGLISMCKLDLSISIVTFNAKEYLDQFIASIYENTKQVSFEILVVDNASSDGTERTIRNKYPDVDYIFNSKGRYYAGGTNQNLRRARGRYIVTFTPDTLVLPNTLDRMVSFMDEEKHVGALTCRIIYPDGSLQYSIGPFITRKYGLYAALGLHALFPDNSVSKHQWECRYDSELYTTGEVLYGACIMVRQELVKEVGVFDEKLRIGWQEYDWCKRIAEKGWELGYLQTASIVHYRGQSKMMDDAKKLAKINREDTLWLFRKHFGFWTYAIMQIAYLLQMERFFSVLRKLLVQVKQ